MFQKNDGAKHLIRKSWKGEKLDALDIDNFCDLHNKEKGKGIGRERRVLIEECPSLG